MEFVHFHHILDLRNVIYGFQTGDHNLPVSDVHISQFLIYTLYFTA